MCTSHTNPTIAQHTHNVDIHRHTLCFPAYLCCLWGHNNTSIVLTRLELLHVLIKYAYLLLIVPARWTVMWVSELVNINEHKRQRERERERERERCLTWIQHLCPLPKQPPWRAFHMLYGLGTYAVLQGSSPPWKRHKTELHHLRETCESRTKIVLHSLSRLKDGPNFMYVNIKPQYHKMCSVYSPQMGTRWLLRDTPCVNHLPTEIVTLYIQALITPKTHWIWHKHACQHGKNPESPQQVLRESHLSSIQWAPVNKLLHHNHTGSTQTYPSDNM